MPLTLLGCKVEVRELSAGWRVHGQHLRDHAAAAGVRRAAAADARPRRGDIRGECNGGRPAGGELSFEEMKLPQLKEELAAARLDALGAQGDAPAPAAWLAGAGGHRAAYSAVRRGGPG